MSRIDAVLFDTVSGVLVQAGDLTIRDIEALTPTQRDAFEQETGWKLVPNRDGTLWGMRRGDARRPIDGGRA
ncbi:MAG: hypothetical protein HOW73_20270 [Polyangiaceae bacterium]|nr:hypothetical protein [Polyangiaceae bacterium]